MDFYHLQEKTKHKYWIKDQMLPKIAVEFISNKIADAVNKSNDDKIVKQETVEEMIIKQIEKSMIKLIQYKISEL